MPQVVFVDAGNWGDVVYDFCREKLSGPRFRPAIGYGLSQNSRRYRSYRHPKKKSSEVKLIGEEYYVVWLPEERLFRVDFNADHWKTELFHGLRTPPGEAGAVELFHSSDPNEHLSLAKQYAAERPVEVFTPGFGTEMKWVKEKKKNHFLDNAANVLCAFHLLGARLIKNEDPPKIEEPPPPARPFLGPDGRPYLLTDRD